jgi:predicted transcriptional regulator
LALLNPYEIVSKSALPALRAMISRRLREKYGLTQQMIARKLGVTQASISNYTRKIRGVMVNLEDDPVVSKAADKIAELLSSEDSDRREVVRTMTEVLDYIRFTHLMCPLHSTLEPDFDVNGCDACDGALTGKEFERVKAIAGQN